MKPLSIVPPNTKIDFVGKRKIAFVLSGLLIAISIVTFLIQGLNLGIDFRGGILIEVQTKEAADIPSLRSTMGELNLGEVQIQEFGAPNDVLIRIQRQEGDEAEQLAAIQQVRDILGDTVADAAARSYEAVAGISWEDAYFRRDIGHRAIARERS